MTVMHKSFRNEVKTPRNDIYGYINSIIVVYIPFKISQNSEACASEL